MKRMLYWPLLVLLFLIVLGGSAAAQGSQQPAPGDESAAPPAEPTTPGSTDNHTPGTATPLACGVFVNDAISAAGQKDWFKIETGATWSIVVTVNAYVNGSPLDAVLTLYDENGTTVETKQDDFNGLDPRLHWNTMLNTPGVGTGSRHYVQVEDHDGDGSQGGSTYTYAVKWEYARYIGMTTAGTVDGVAYQPGDILTWVGCGSNTHWEMFFDGSDVGLNGNLRDFAVLNGERNSNYPSGTIIMAMDKQTLPFFGTVVAQDLVHFTVESYGENTNGFFSRYFDGSDVGLTKGSETIDGVTALGSGLLLSTTGKAALPPALVAADEDALYFDAGSYGTTTTGTWSMFLDGSDVGAGRGDLKSLHYLPADYLLANFDRTLTLDGVTRTPDRVAACDPGTWGTNTDCTWGVAHQGLYDMDLAGAILDGYDEGSHWWPVDNGVLAPDSLPGK